MKNFRLLAAALLTSAVVSLAPAQSSDDFTSLRAKAEKGNSIAQYNLGLAYAEGHGTAVDRVEAYVWLSLARENGARGRALDTLIASLDRPTLQAAQQRLADYKGTANEKIPVVTTTQNEPEIVTTIKTSHGPEASASAASEAGSLSEQVAALTADKKQLSAEVAKAWKEIEVLNAALSKAEKDVRAKAPDQKTKELQAAKAELESVGKFSHELEASLNRTNEQKTLLEQSLAAARTELARSKEELAEQSRKAANLAALEASRLTPSAEIAAIRQQLEASRAEVKELTAAKTALAGAQSQADTLAAELAAVRASENKLRETVAQLEQEKTRLAAAPDLSGRVGELEAQLVQANRNAEASTQAAVTASKQSAADLSASAAQILRLQSALATKSAGPSYPDLSGKVRELEAAVADSNKKLIAAGTAQSDLQRQLAEATTAAKNAAKTSSDDVPLRHERDQLVSRVASLTSENTVLRTDRERMQKLLADSGKQQRDSAADVAHIKELESQVASLQTSLNSASARMAALKNAPAPKSAAPAYPDLSDKVRDLESRLVATNRQADEAVKTAVAASKQNVADLNSASAQIAELRAALAAKPAASSVPDLSGRVHELETQLAASVKEASRAKEQVAALNKAKEESRDRGPAYPNLAGRVVELQTALADAKRDLSDTQAALRAAEQARTVAAAPVAPAPVVTATASEEPSDLQKQLAETENKLNSALRGYALLQRERDEQIEGASKAAEAVTTERDSLSAKVASLSAELEELKSGAANQTAAAQAEAARSAESLAALQRSTSQNSIDLAATRALLKQVQGAYTVLARENYELKTRLSPGVPASANASVAPVGVPAAPTAPTAPAAARTHVVVAGDTLSRISQRYYGTPARWREIYQANIAKLGTNGVLRVGSELVVP